MSQARLAPEMVLRNTYRIVRPIGRGGMGEIYEATHERLAGRYAIKVLHADTTAHPEALLRFRREARITSSLRHPNVVQVVDFDVTGDGWPYLVMEYLEGPELAELLRAGPLPLPRALSLIEQIGAGLSAVHAQGIVHRDLKPQNVFVLPVAGGGELAKLVDFGISKAEFASQKLTSESAFLGTPQYMAPEQAVGRSADVDARADQFSLAVMAYEMLTGRLPFVGDTPISLVYQIVNVDPPLVGSFTQGVPAGVEAALRRALAKQPGARFPSVAELVAALRAGAPDVSPTGPTQDARPPAGPPRRSSRRLIAGGAAVALAAAVALFALVRPGAVSSRARDAQSAATATRSLAPAPGGGAPAAAAAATTTTTTTTGAGQPAAAPPAAETRAARKTGRRSDLHIPLLPDERPGPRQALVQDL